MLVANNTDRTTGMPIAYTTQNATRAPSQTLAPIAVQVLFSPASWTIRIAAAAMGNVSRKFACARFIRPPSGVGGGQAASRDDTAHLIPYRRPSSPAPPPAPPPPSTRHPAHTANRQGERRGK